MHNEQRRRAHDLLESKHIQRALFADPYSIAWLTGFAPPPQVGPGPFAGGPPLLWYEAGAFTLILLEAYHSDAVPVIKYPGYTVEAPISSAQDLSAIIDRLARKAHTPIGIEQQHLPAFLLTSLNDTTAVDGLLAPLRMVKTDEELADLRQAFALSDTGHAAARRATRAGAREIDVWTAAHSAVQQAAGMRVPFGNDCVVNTRENNIGGWPSTYEIPPDGSLMVDLSVRWNAYWSDSCATYYPGEPTERQRALHAFVAEALDFAISLVRPGVPANEIDRQVRRFVADAGHRVYPHHTGHGVGVSPHEEPRIVPYNAQRLEPGMVVMLEPGIYVPREAAVRLEHALLVTNDGAEVLTRHDIGL
jgi:Xaa-Pro aminopeptidase